MKGYVTKSLLFLACLFFLAMNVLAANPSSLADGAQLLKGSERIAVLNELGNIERKYGVRLAVVTVKTTNKVKIGDYANQLLDRREERQYGPGPGDGYAGLLRSHR